MNAHHGHREVWFRPQIQDTDIVLEPCAGQGAFERAFLSNGITNVRSCEITRGQDFFQFTKPVDWLITNPPWSLTRRFLQHSYTVASNSVWLVTISHILALEARLRDMRTAGYGIKEILLCATPPMPWPQSGFQLGVCHLQRGWSGPIQFGNHL